MFELQVLGPVVLRCEGVALPLRTHKALACTAANGKFACPMGNLPSGTYSVLWDREPPPRPTFDTNTPALQAMVVKVPELGPGGRIALRVRASDPHGLGGVEVVEMTGTVPAGSSDSGATNC